MAEGRRTEPETAHGKALILDATEQVMIEEGYAAVTSRNVAARAGVTGGLIHYYFPTLDDLFLAVYRRRTGRNIERLAEALQGDQPLRVIWKYSSDPTGAALTAELLVMANHRKAIQAEIAETAEAIRRMQLKAVTEVLEGYGIDAEELPAPALLLFMAAVPRVIVIEQALGVSTGHVEAIEVVERWLERLEGPPRSRRATAKPRRTPKGKRVRS
jgi:AcrR family transcriptional regulator